MFNLKKSILVLMFSGFGLETITNNVNAIPPDNDITVSRTIFEALFEIIELRLMISRMGSEQMADLHRDGDTVNPYTSPVLRWLHTASQAQLPRQVETIEAIRERIKETKGLNRQKRIKGTIGVDGRRMPDPDLIFNQMFEEAQRIDPAFLEAITTDLHALETSIGDETIHARVIGRQREWVQNIRGDALRDLILQNIQWDQNFYALLEDLRTHPQ